MLLREYVQWGFNNRGWSATTQEKYERVAKALERWLQEHRKKSVLWAGEKDLKAWLFSTPPTATTRNHYRQAIVAFYEFLVDSGYVERNVALALPRVPQKLAIPKALTSAQAYAIEQAARVYPMDVQVLINVFLYLLLRHSEARLLEWRQLDLDNAWVNFTAKGGKERVLPIAESLNELLWHWRDECPDPRWVFPSRYGKVQGRPLSKSWVRKTVRRVGDDAHIPDLHPHQLRHTAATRLLEQGVDIRTLQELLGHSSLQTTQVYLRVRPANLRGALEGLRYRDEGGSDGGTPVGS